MADNVVNRLQIELEAPALDVALCAQEWFAARAEATLEEVIDRCPHSVDWDHHIIDRLEIDLGCIDLSDLGDALVARFAEALQKELSSITFDRYSRSSEDAPLPTPTRVLHFLKYGTLPWWSSPVSLDALIAELDGLAVDEPLTIRAWFDRETTRTVTLALRRSSLQLGDTATRHLLATIGPRSVELGSEINARLPPSFDRSVLWAAIALVVHSTPGGESELEAGESGTWLSGVLQAIEPADRPVVKNAWDACGREQAGSEHEQRAESRTIGSGHADPVSRVRPVHSSTVPRRVDETLSTTNTGDSKWSQDDHRAEDSKTRAEDSTTTAEAEFAPAGQCATGRSTRPAGIARDRTRAAEPSAEDPGGGATIARSGIESQTDSSSKSSAKVHEGSGDDTAVRSLRVPNNYRREKLHGRDKQQPSILAEPTAPLRQATRLADVSGDIAPWTSAEPALAVDNAGLVLLWPFLGKLFREVGYRDADGWSTEHHQHRAIHILQWMATGERCSAPEHMLSLNKVLTGFELEAPVSSEIVLNGQERHEADDLLRAVVLHWSMLKSTSIDGLRSTFLLRSGLLEKCDGRFRLRVEGTAFDVLMEHLPWGLELVQLSWMHRPLEVQWWTP